MTTRRFEEYISFLRENFINVIDYKSKTGKFDPALLQVQKDLFHKDPFVVFSASLLATVEFADKSLYH